MNPPINRRSAVQRLAGLGLLLLAACDDDPRGTPLGADGGETDAEPIDAEPLPDVPTWDGGPPDDWMATRATVDAWFEGVDRDAIRAVGRAWLARAEALETQLQTLVDAITAEGLPGLEAALAADFRDVNLVAVDGWQLAVTEARLCGLAERLA